MDRLVVTIAVCFMLWSGESRNFALADDHSHADSESTVADADVESDDGSMAYLAAIREGRVEQVRETVIDIGFQVAEGSPAPLSVDLFVTTNQGVSWSKAVTVDGDVGSLTYQAPEDGLYGFFLVLHGATGCTPNPNSGSIPQKWVMVDRQEPNINLREMDVETTVAGASIIHVRWLATDATNNLPVGPVTISYMNGQVNEFRVIARGLEAAGEFDWHVPMNVTGEVRLRLEAVDRAGNRSYFVTHSKVISGIEKSIIRTNKRVALGDSQDDSQVINTNAVNSEKADEKSQEHGNVSAFKVEQVVAKDSVDLPVLSEASEAEKQYDLATWHRKRGEYDQALRRYRDALAIEANLYKARNDLAGTLLLLDRIDESEAAFRTILDAKRDFAPALEGLAVVQIRQRRYRSAHSTLTELLRLRPSDEEALLQFGDVCMFTGDRRGARAAWNKVTQLEDASPEALARAKQRLSIYQRDQLGLIAGNLE